MDLYSVSDGVSVGNELSRNAREQNQSRESANALMVMGARNTLKNDKGNEEKDVGAKSVGDTTALAETPSVVGRIADKGVSDATSESIANIKSAGSSLKRGATSVKRAGQTVADAVESSRSSFKPGGSALVDEAETSGQAVASRTAGVMGAGTSRALRGTGITVPTPTATPTGTTPSTDTPTDTPSDIPASTAGSTGEDIGNIAKGINSETGTFDNVVKAGSVTKYILNKGLGITSDVGLELGSKAVGGLGGAYSAEQDISNLVTSKGKSMFKKGESWESKVGNVGSIIGAGLDVASVALPVLAPFALVTNLLSAGAGTAGAIEDDKNQISTDSKPPAQQTLSIHPAWSGIGMVASVHSSPTVA